MPSVLIFAIDGLQPLQVTEELMPNLAAFSAGSVFFDNHHPVYPSVTRVNAASIMTGCYPGRHGLVGNTLVIREYDRSRAFSALVDELATVVEKTGRLLFRPTLAEIISGHGKRFVTVGTGSSGNSFVHNPKPKARHGRSIHPEFTIPEELGAELTERFGEWGERTHPDYGRNEYATRVLTEYVLDDCDLAIYWSDEPDHAQHAAGVNSEHGKEALTVADNAFGKVIEHLDNNGRLTETDIMVVSDHGYSTSRGLIGIESLVEHDCPVPVVLGTNGASVLFWVPDRSTETVDRLAEWLMRQPWCGAVTVPDAHGGVEGTLPARLVGQEGERSPDLTMSFTWDSEPNEAGVPGLAHTAGQPVGQGDHGSLSKHEMRNTLIAGGPSFKSAVRVGSPTGNVDLAPTALRILGLPGGERMDGRVLEEALADGPDPDSVASKTETFSAERELGHARYRQEITTTSVGKTTYVDQGSAERTITT